MRLRPYQVGFVAAQLLVAWQITYLSPAHRGGMYSTFLAPGIYVAFATDALLNRTMSNARYDAVLIGANLVVYGVIGGCVGWLMGRVARRWIRSSASKSDCCPCGYDLTGNLSGVCPECGRATKHLEGGQTEFDDMQATFDIPSQPTSHWLIVVRSCPFRLAVLLFIVAGVLEFRTCHRLSVFNREIDHAYDVYIHLPIRGPSALVASVDVHWLQWVNENGGFACTRFVQRFENAKKDVYTLGSSPPIFPSDMRVEIAGNGWVYAISALGGAVILLSIPILTIVVRSRTGQCIGCGYCLKGSPGPRCSECGLAIRESNLREAAKPTLRFDPENG